VRHFAGVSFIAGSAFTSAKADALSFAAAAMDRPERLAPLIASREEVVGNISMLAR